MNTRKQTNSFTLVELFVVLAIIAIFVVMLIPALAKARRTATAVKILRPARQPNEAYKLTLTSRLSLSSDVDYLIKTDSDLTAAVTIPKKIDRFPATITISKGTSYSTKWEEMGGKDVFVIGFPYYCDVTLHPEESDQLIKAAERLVQESKAEESAYFSDLTTPETEVRLKLPEGATGWSQLYLGEVGGGFGFSVVVDTSGPFVPPVFVFQLTTCSDNIIKGGFTFKVTKPELLNVTGTTVLWGNKSVPIVSVYGALDIQPLSKPLAEKETER